MGIKLGARSMMKKGRIMMLRRLEQKISTYHFIVIGITAIFLHYAGQGEAETVDLGLEPIDVHLCLRDTEKQLFFERN